MSRPNEGLEPTPSSVRCAPASRRGSGPALGCKVQARMPSDGQSVRRVSRIPDRFDRDGAFSIELGDDRDDTVQQMIALNESLYVFSTKKIFRIHTADDIDPDRTAPDTRHSYQEIYPIGCSNSFVARSIIQAKQILDGVILAPGLSKSNVLDAIWEAAELLLRCENAYFQIYNETLSLLATCDWFAPL
jgi:hypothetical protein